MAPTAQASQQAYAKDERVLCFHHELLYEAKVLDSKLSDPSDKKSQILYRVHYKGWKNTWDDWVSGDRVRKLTDENRELAQNLKKELDALRKPVAPKVVGSKKKHAGSDLSSTRGSEERQSSAPATGRGQKRGRDSEIEKVGSLISPSVTSSPLSELSTSDESSLPWNQEHFHGVHTGRDSPSSSKISGSSGSRELAAMKVTNAAGQPQAKRRRKSGSTTTSKCDSEQMESNVDRILSRSPPLEPRFPKVHPNGLSTNYLGMLESCRKKLPKPTKNTRRLHPSIKEADLLSCSREAKLQFFMFQDHNLKIMIAGVPIEGSLHPLHIPDTYLTRSTISSERDRDINGYHEFDINRSPFQEETFYSRPHIRIPCPDNLKSILVDDWENVTKNLLLVPLPSKTPVNFILDTYFEEEKGKRRLGSAEADLLEEVVAGVKEYFDKCLGRILLYRFEREQFFDVRKLWEGAVGGEWEGKGPGDVYGAEHLARLFVSMPELIAQTNMDHQAVNRLREELAKITQWLGKNSAKYFTAEYESATQEYIDKARGV